MYDDNLLIKLHNLCGKQDENFITESFVHLLRLLKDLDPVNATEMFRYLTNDMVSIEKENVNTVEINTQVTIDSGRPDIEIKYGKYLILLEVKVESDFESTQLDRYSQYLNSINGKETSLITITKYPFQNSSNTVKPDYSVRWHDIHSILIELNTKSEIVSHYINQFIELMRYRGLSMNSVKWEMTEGIKSFKNLMDMIGESLSNTHYKFKTAVAWEWFGYYIDNSTYWVGMSFVKPNTILFHTSSIENSENIEEINYGVIANSRWENTLDLSSEKEYFFARTKESQINLIDCFINDSLKYAETLHTKCNLKG